MLSWSQWGCGIQLEFFFSIFSLYLFTFWQIGTIKTSDKLATNCSRLPCVQTPVTGLFSYWRNLRGVTFLRQVLKGVLRGEINVVRYVEPKSRVFDVTHVALYCLNILVSWCWAANLHLRSVYPQYGIYISKPTCIQLVMPKTHKYVWCLALICYQVSFTLLVLQLIEHRFKK